MPEDRFGDTSVLTSLFRHNTWANLKLLDFCVGLNDDQLQATAMGTHGSIRATLAHLVGAEVDYVNRATGTLLAEWVTGDVFPGFEALKDAARRAGDEFTKLALAARADDVVRETFPQESIVIEYPLGSLLVQAINHATEHREQISSIITQLGVQPPHMTGWAYMEEMGEFRQRQSGVGASGVEANAN